MIPRSATGRDGPAAGLSVRVTGQDRGGPAVLLEPGLGASSVGWSRVRRQVADLTRVITYDRAGLGMSPSGNDRRGLDELVTDLAHVIHDHGGHRPVILVGHSLGATLARHLTATRPELVTGLVLIDPIPERWALRHGAWAVPFGLASYGALEFTARLGLMDRVMALPVLRGVTRSSTSPLAAFTNAERDALAAEMRNPTSHRTARREFTGLLASRAALRALASNPAITAPVTIISAGRTHALAAHLRRAATAWHAQLVAVSPDARHVVVADGDHFLPRYQPEIVTAAVADLLDRLCTGRGYTMDA